MQKALEEKLAKFEDDHGWAGITTEDMAEVTIYTLEKLKEHLDETGAVNEASAIQTALGYAETHLET